MRFIPHQDANKSIKIISKIAKNNVIITEVISSYVSCPIVNYTSHAFHLVEEVAAEV